MRTRWDYLYVEYVFASLTASDALVVPLTYRCIWPDRTETFEHYKDSIELLGTLGNFGWELVCRDELVGQRTVVYYFKRQAEP